MIAIKIYNRSMVTEKLNNNIIERKVENGCLFDLRDGK